MRPIRCPYCGLWETVGFRMWGIGVWVYCRLCFGSCFERWHDWPKWRLN